MKIDEKTTIDFKAGAIDEGDALHRRHVSLVLYHRDGVKVVPLIEGVDVVVGRAWPSDVVIADMSLSRHHARFKFTEHSVQLEDLGSTNGTLLDGHRIAAGEIRRVGPESTISLGGIMASISVAMPQQEGLSGIDEHDRFIRALEDEVVRSKTFRRTMALMMIRALSTEHGHVSRWCPRVHGQLRPVDRITLYGPGSVLVLMPEIAAEEVERHARQLLFGAPGEPQLVAGLAIYPDTATSADELVEAARNAARQADVKATLQVATGATGTPSPVASSIVIESPRMREVWALVQRVARSQIPVLIHGETGTGKEVVARAIHVSGPRREKPLRTINCGAIPTTLIESVLFGHEKGAFTGADRTAKGVFEQANGGTVFLDEVAELSAAAQAALLRALETKRINRVGSAEEIEVDVRIVAASHRDLDAMTRDGSFRTDLLYRLNAMVIAIPALRERQEEIVPLAELFLKEACKETGIPHLRIDEEAAEQLRRYAWPGNVRELRNVIDRAVVVCQGPSIRIVDLAERVRGRSMDAIVDPQADSRDPSLDFKERIRQYETALIVDALRRSSGNQTEAAKLLRMPLRTLVHKLKVYGIRKSYEAE